MSADSSRSGQTPRGSNRIAGDKRHSSSSGGAQHAEAEANVLVEIVEHALAAIHGLLSSSAPCSERVALRSLCRPSIGPLQDGVKRRTKGLAPWCQAVFNLRRHLRIGRTHNDSVHCQAAKLLPQHLLSDVGYRSFQIGEAHHLASE